MVLEGSTIQQYTARTNGSREFQGTTERSGRRGVRDRETSDYKSPKHGVLQSLIDISTEENEDTQSFLAGPVKRGHAKMDSINSAVGEMAKKFQMLEHCEGQFLGHMYGIR